jgi:hypothetical protein
MDVACNPKNSKCVNGTRLIPIKLTDIAGLVPGAHTGKGLGNRFLAEIMEAKALIHVLDVSGGTDANGNPVPPGTHDPAEDIKFLEEEMDWWIYGILQKKWKVLSRKFATQKPAIVIAKQLSGLGIGDKEIENIISEAGVPENEDELFNFVRRVRKVSKPMLIAANKIDVPESEKNIKPLQKQFSDRIIIPCCAEAELALRRAEQKGLIKYTPGSNSFKLIKTGLEEKQKKALEFISKLLEAHGSTGVQSCLNRTVFDLLGYIVVYPVENENKLTDKHGNVLPDAMLVPAGTTAKDLAFRIHTDIGKKFISAINCRTKRRIGADAELKNGDIIKILI